MGVGGWCFKVGRLCQIVIKILTNLLDEVEAKAVAQLYRKRWLIETILPKRDQHVNDLMFLRLNCYTNKLAN